MIRHAAAAAFFASAAHAQVRIQITGDPTRAPYAIAIPKPLGDAAVAAEAQDAMRADFDLAGLFRVLDERGFLADFAAEAMGIKADDWAKVGAQGVIKARATRHKDDVEIEFRFYEVAKGGDPSLTKSYRGTALDARLLAHRFDNDVYKLLTGEDGVFLTRIAYARPDGGKQEIVVVDADGHRPRTIVSNGSQNLLPAWSPSGERLAFTSLLWMNPDLFVVPASGGRAVRVSRQAGLNTGASFAPDGKTIALTLSRDGNAELYLVSASDGAVLKRLTNHEAIDTSPAFSPDGSQIAFVSNRHGTPQIWVMSASGGGEPRRVTLQGKYNQSPRWNPRPGTRELAFTGQDERGRFDVFTLDLAKGTTVRVTQNQGDNWEPTWAPNGRLLAFSSSRGGLWVVTPDGQHQVQITKGAAETPAWSPWVK